MWVWVWVWVLDDVDAGALVRWLQGPADIFREHATLSGLGNKGTRRFDISALAALDDAGYDAMPPTRWP